MRWDLCAIQNNTTKLPLYATLFNFLSNTITFSLGCLAMLSDASVTFVTFLLLAPVNTLTIIQSISPFYNPIQDRIYVTVRGSPFDRSRHATPRLFTSCIGRSQIEESYNSFSVRTLPRLGSPAFLHQQGSEVHNTVANLS